MNLTITPYYGNGQFGPMISGPAEELAEHLARPHLEGHFDAATQYYDIEAGEVKPKAPTRPILSELRNRRDHLLDAHRWTIMPDSPLTESCKSLWLTYLRSLHVLLIGYDETFDIVWPETPGYEYETT
jgi:hypothetical protein